MTIFHSPLPDVELPKCNLTQMLMEKMENHSGDKPAFIDSATGRSYTFPQISKMIKVTGTNLVNNHNFAKGDCFGIYMPNLIEWPIIFHGVLFAGGYCTTINPLYTVDELHKQLVDSKAKYIITISLFLEKTLEAIKDTNVRTVFVLSPTPVNAEASDEVRIVDAKTLLVPGPNFVPVQVDVSPDDIAVLPYSSGTTGVPKGVMITHANMACNIVQTIPFEAYGSDEVLTGVLPFFHIFGMVVILNVAIYKGCSVVVFSKFELEPFLQAIQTYKINRAHIVPPIVLALAKHPLVDKYDLSSLKTILSAAAPLGAGLTSLVKQRLGVAVKQGFGMTESSPVVMVDYDDADKIKPGSVGQIICNTEAKFVDVATGEELGVGQEGELCIRGAQVMKGYLNNEEATANTVKDGWLHTGDIGYIDSDGYTFLVDRVKELIKFKGYQVPPAELEALLLSHPSVSDAAVVPVPDVEAGELPKAYVVKKPDTAITEEELMAFVAGKVAPYKKIRFVEFIDQIPKSATGKILRRILKDKERAIYNKRIE